MAQATWSNQSFELASFAAEQFTPEKLLNAGAKLVAAEFTETDGKRPVQAGFFVGRTFVERDAGTGFGVADSGTPDDELYLTAFEVVDANINADVTLLRHGTLIYEDKLPGWSGLSAGDKAAIRAAYQCIAAAA